MAFNPEQSMVPTSVGDIAIILTDHCGAQPDEVQYEIQVLQADGSLFRLATGNAEPHLTAEQKTTLTGFMTEIRTKAEMELLP